MGDSTIRLEPAKHCLSYVETRLEANGLPTDDVRSKPESFYLAYAGDQRVGIGGLEHYDDDALLRSLVVERTVRGEGVGTALCDALESTAADAGVESLYLLTTTAAPFFADRGYVEIDRDAAPDEIRETSEFADLCPSSATCMMRSL